MKKVAPKKNAGKSAAPRTLDDLLPMITPEHRELHLNAAVIEVAEPSQLAELASHPKIRNLLLYRLSETVALVEPGEADVLEDMLKSYKYTPKVARGE